MLHLHRIDLEKALGLDRALVVLFLPFYPKLIKMALYLYSSNIKSWKQVFISHLVCFVDQVRKSSLTL
jgi:hypothetical protein